jgi:hypothetical protein
MPTPDASQYTQIKRILSNATASVAESALKFRAPIGLSGYGFVPGLKARFGPNALTSNKFLQDVDQTTTVDAQIVFASYPLCDDLVIVLFQVTFGVDITSVEVPDGLFYGVQFTITGARTAELVIDPIPVWGLSNEGIFEQFPNGIPVSFCVNGKYIVNGVFAEPNIQINGSPYIAPNTYDASPATPFETGGSIYFTGEVDAYACVGVSSNFVAESEVNFTVMWWQFFDTRGTNNTQSRVFSMGDSTNGEVFAFSMDGTGDIRTLKLWINNTVAFIVPDIVIGNAWHHIAIIRAGPILTLYIDGVSHGSLEGEGILTTRIGSAIDNVNLGHSYTRKFQSQAFIGYISKFVFVTNYAKYIGNFDEDLPINDIDLSSQSGIYLLCSDPANFAVNSASGGEYGLNFFAKNQAHAPGWAPRPS